MRIRIVLFAASFAFSIGSAHAKNTPTLTPIENISVKMFATGDLQEEYDFTGPMGAKLKASSKSTVPVCSFSSLFRKVQYRGKPSIEAWLVLDCTFEGQKSSYKPHRIYLSLDKTSKKIKLPMLAKNLKNVQLEFQELSLKSRK